MWIADNWKDYEVIDCSGGEKLERWKSYILLRPDPQVIWDTKRSAPAWQNLNAHYHRSTKGGGEWEFFQLPEEWTIDYLLLPWHGSYLHFVVRPSLADKFEEKSASDVGNTITKRLNSDIAKEYGVSTNYRALNELCKWYVENVLVPVFQDSAE